MMKSTKSTIKKPLKTTKVASENGISINEQIKAIPAREVRSPNMPVGVFLQEAFNIYRFMQEDRELFRMGGFDWMLVEKLPERMGFLREAEAALWKAKYSYTPVEKEYEQQQALAVQARGKLLRDLEFACRDDADALRMTREIKKDSGQSGFNMGLVNLGELASGRIASLTAIGSDPRLIDDVKACAESLTRLCALRIVEQAAAEEKRNLRDRAYTFLAAAIEKIRRCAHYALSNEPRRLKGYASEYFRKSNRAGKRGGGKEAG